MRARSAGGVLFIAADLNPEVNIQQYTEGSNLYLNLLLQILYRTEVQKPNYKNTKCKSHDDL